MPRRLKAAIHYATLIAALEALRRPKACEPALVGGHFSDGGASEHSNLIAAHWYMYLR